MTTDKSTDVVDLAAKRAKKNAYERERLAKKRAQEIVAGVDKVDVKIVVDGPKDLISAALDRGLTVEQFAEIDTRCEHDRARIWTVLQGFAVGGAGAAFDALASVSTIVEQVAQQVDSEHQVDVKTSLDDVAATIEPFANVDDRRAFIDHRSSAYDLAKAGADAKRDGKSLAWVASFTSDHGLSEEQAGIVVGGYRHGVEETAPVEATTPGRRRMHENADVDKLAQDAIAEQQAALDRASNERKSYSEEQSAPNEKRLGAKYDDVADAQKAADIWGLKNFRIARVGQNGGVASHYVIYQTIDAKPTNGRAAKKAEERARRAAAVKLAKDDAEAQRTASRAAKAKLASERAQAKLDGAEKPAKEKSETQPRDKFPKEGTLNRRVVDLLMRPEGVTKAEAIAVGVKVSLKSYAVYFANHLGLTSEQVAEEKDVRWFLKSA